MIHSFGLQPSSVAWSLRACCRRQNQDLSAYYTIGNGDDDEDDDENYQKNICMNTIPPPYADPSSIGAMPI